MTVTDDQLIAWLTAWMWPFFRIMALLAAAPIFGHRAVPSRIKLGAALILTLAVAPVLPPMPAVDPLSGEGIGIVVNQVLIGALIGFTIRLTFVVLELAGQQIAQLMGLSFATMVDPGSGASVPLVSQLYVVLATLVFLGIDGHLVVIEVLVTSFTLLPVGGGALAPDSFRGIVDLMGWVFAASTVMALPAVAALLTVNVSFGVVTKTAPQFNIFAVGFPVTLLFGFAIMLLTLPGAVRSIGAIFDRGFDGASRLLLGG